MERGPGCRRSPGPLHYYYYYYYLELPPDGSFGVFLVVDIYIVFVGVLLEATNQRRVCLRAATRSAAGRWLERQHYRASHAGGPLVDMSRRGGLYAFGAKRVANRIRGDHDNGSAPAAVGVAWSGHFFLPTKLGL
jgi:hypothetical protein